MPQIMIFLHFIGSLQGYAVTFIQVCFLRRIHVGYSVCNNSPDKLAKTPSVVYSTPCLHKPLQQKRQKKKASWRKVPIWVQEQKLRLGYRWLPQFYRVRFHSTLFHSHITSNIDARESVMYIQPTASHVVLGPSSDIQGVFIYFKNHTNLVGG